jgi:hypothetical protein
MNEPASWTLSLGSHDQSIKGQLSAQVIAHHSTHHIPGREIQQGRRIEPALACGDIGDVDQLD